MLINSVGLVILDPIWQILEEEAYPMSGNSPEYLLVSSWARVWSLILLCNQAPSLVSNRGWNLVNACSHSLVNVYKLDLMRPKGEELEHELSSALEKQTQQFWNTYSKCLWNANTVWLEWTSKILIWSEGLFPFSAWNPFIIHISTHATSHIFPDFNWPLKMLWGLTEAGTWGRGISTG